MKQAFIRLSVLIILLINQTLLMIGWEPLPFNEEQIYEAVSTVALVAVSLWSWWKNNDVTKEAQQATKQMKAYKSKKGRK